MCQEDTSPSADLATGVILFRELPPGRAEVLFVVAATTACSRHVPALDRARDIAKSREERHETSPPQTLASGPGRCRAAGRVAHCEGTDLSVAAGASDCSVRAGRHDR